MLLIIYCYLLWGKGRSLLNAAILLHFQQRGMEHVSRSFIHSLICPERVCFAPVLFLSPCLFSPSLPVSPLSIFFFPQSALDLKGIVHEYCMSLWMWIDTLWYDGLDTRWCMEMVDTLPHCCTEASSFTVVRNFPSCIRDISVAPPHHHLCGFCVRQIKSWIHMAPQSSCR